MRLTDHFDTIEFERSFTAISMDIDNSMPDECRRRAKDLCINVLEPLRQHLDRPVIISSGYRCKELNDILRNTQKKAKLKASNTSQHMSGEAADVACASAQEAKDVFAYIRDHLPFDQLILERSKSRWWVHVSYRKERLRRETLDYS